MDLFVFLTVLFLSNFNCISCTEIEETESIFESNDTLWLSYSHSPVDLWHLTKTEEDLFTLIKDYVTKLDHEPEYFFRRYIADYEDSSTVAFNSWNSSSGKRKFSLVHTNPLWSYRMIWRFVTDLPSIKDVLLSSDDSEIVDAFHEKISPLIAWPTQEDLNNSMTSLLNLHFVYDLNLTEFANGIIANVTTNASLSAIHCYEISKYAWYKFKHTLAVEWLEIAELKRLNVSGHPILDYLEDTVVMKLLEDIIKEHDDNWLEEMPHESNLYSYYNKIDSDYILTSQKKVLQAEFKGKGDGGPHMSLNDVAAFSTLCKGGNLQSEKEKLELYCWYESKINPAFYISPQKMELVSKNPYVFQVYDFIGEDLIKYLKKESIPVMERSQVSHVKNISDDVSPDIFNKHTNYSDSRTSMFSWLYEPKYWPRLPTLSKRIGYLTGLIASMGTDGTSNALQVSVYATGGQFNLHVDPLESTDEIDDLMGANIGDRLATFMLYLNDVELGGYTAFTSAGVAVPPVKGSAVFWYDSKRNGEVDFMAWHGGCPVLLGEKWVGNKWIHNNLNMFQLKCTLNKDE